MTEENKTEIAIFAGGCFWCTEALFKSLKGVISVVSGYGSTGSPQAQDKAPTYEEVSTGKTGFAECVKIEYDPSMISFGDLLSVFFNTHDPTTLNQQGADFGTQYRSAIFYTTPEQKDEAEKLIKELNEAKAYEKSAVTEVVPFTKFYEAEDYHKNYYENNSGAPYCQIVIAPKLEKLQKRFNNLLK